MYNPDPAAQPTFVGQDSITLLVLLPQPVWSIRATWLGSLRGLLWTAALFYLAFFVRVGVGQQAHLSVVAPRSLTQRRLRAQALLRALPFQPPGRACRRECREGRRPRWTSST
jgi:hypothetical protein